MGTDDFDPEAPDEREIGREMVEQNTGLGSVVAHMYRGEVAREISWRERLDATTNWAVTVIAGILAYAFSADDVSHTIILVGMGSGLVFLVIEARRFQRYDVWRSRVRSMQENLFANALDPSGGVEQRDWRRQLSEDYRSPTSRLSLRLALAHRLRRVYLPLLVGLLFVWLFRLAGGDESVVAAAGVSNTPGWVVLGAVGVVYLCLVAVAFWPGARAVSELDEEVDRGDLRRDE
ncbi:DUF2270 domain-containing protein [Halosimplex halophilum]|uniref:DUF2270 domain-containing protein n=1 Tax=Halosimplex halophilum TaxID=2559572 RepID=UPI00107F9FE4|nr:DUF2270 domain-containing protein [Halosimplex halophilum]